jgi:2-octaprenyl-6-methoxyphenol hydroxylase
LTDGLNHLFSTDLVPAQLVRSAALTALDQVAPLKRLAMRRGMGLTGDLPRLARGEPLR